MKYDDQDFIFCHDHSIKKLTFKFIPASQWLCLKKMKQRMADSDGERVQNESSSAHTILERCVKAFSTYFPLSQTKNQSFPVGEASSS